MYVFPTISSVPVSEHLTDEELIKSCKRIGRSFIGLDQNNLDPALELSIIMTALESIQTSYDWQRLEFLKGIPTELLNKEFDISFGAGKDALHWHSATINFAALAYLSSEPCRNGQKDLRGISLCKLLGRRRRKAVELDLSEGVTAVCGLSLDDDGVIGRNNINAGPMVIAFSTASDGKCTEIVDGPAFEAFAKRSEIDLTPTPETMSRYLNAGLEHGAAYKDVQLDANYIEGSFGPSYRVLFRAQQRTRYLSLFADPVQGQLLRDLIDKPGAFRTFGELVEYEALGARGTDSACFDPVRVGYLPSGNHPTPYFSILGHPYLLDAIPLAEKALQMATVSVAQRRPINTTRQPNRVRSPGKSSGNLQLRGVRLASLIAEHHRELVRHLNGLKPLVLSCCPFADGHRSDRGKADGSLYCYDPDISPFPVMRCHHNSCMDRLTEDFVAAMIEQGLLDPLVIKAPIADWDFPLPDLATDWRRHISKK
jgi:hypothetical protein